MRPKTVFTNGVFDILHAGHIHLLRTARTMGDRLVVGINSDASVQALSKEPGRPIVPAPQRMAVLNALACVDTVVTFNDPTPLRAIRAVMPHVLVKGGDYTPDEVVGKEFVESYGGKVVIVPLLEGVSTTDIINRIRSC